MQISGGDAPHEDVQLVECPRDAMQGWPHLIPSELKIAYLRLLLEVGFDTLDFGSFVSAKDVPQMADTHEVIRALESWQGPTRLLAIVANERGALEALQYPSISFLGFPFSISPIFQQRNTRASQQAAEQRLLRIQELCLDAGREPVVYLSMGFGNPYGDPYSLQMLLDWVGRLKLLGLRRFSLADTVGLASPAQVFDTYRALRLHFPDLQPGIHLHARPEQALSKLQAAYRAGCRRFDSALGGYGGCPLAEDELVGNLPTETVLDFLRAKGHFADLSLAALEEARRMLAALFV